MPNLATIECANLSLYIDKYAALLPRTSADDKDWRTRCMREIEQRSQAANRARLPADPLRWRVGMPGFQARLAARLIVNHAVGVIENAGLAIDRFHGLPYIPGSALKGLARDAAGLCGATPEQIDLVFGSVEEGSGRIAFLAAYPTASTRLELDIVNCHHAAYYKGDRTVATDDESPILNVFPVVPAGVVFAFHVLDRGGRSLPGFDPVAAAIDWLKAAITAHGVGSKTAAGYGWFEVAEASTPGTSGAAPASDFDKKSFENAVEKRLDRKGEWPLLKKELEKLRKPENAEWKAKFLALVGKDKGYKELRAIVEAP